MGGFGETWRFRTVPTSRMAATVGGIGAMHGDSELLNHFVTISMMAAIAVILKIFNCQLMLWSVDHGPSLIPMSISNFSHSGHLHQNHIHDDRHGGHLENLQLLSAPEL